MEENAPGWHALKARATPPEMKCFSQWVTDMITLSSKWADQLMRSPETGMDYQIVSVVLRDGTQFDQVAVVGGRVVKIRGRKDIPFSEDDIVKIIITHDKWDFGKEQ